jgi:hypothetical protein
LAKKLSVKYASLRRLSKKILERFLLVYALDGCQKAVDFLTKYYGVRRMKIKLNGRKVGRHYVASYFQNKAYFTKKGLTKRTVLHELYHHLAYVKGLDAPKTKEERAASSYARDFIGRVRVGHE